MPLSHLVLNETSDNNERGVKALFHNGAPLNQTTTFPKVSCFRYSTIKLSHYALLDSVITVKFYPSYIYQTCSGSMQNGATGGRVLDRTDVGVNYPTITMNVNGGNYKFFQFAVEGEFMEVIVYSTDGEDHLYLNVGLSNHQNNMHID